MGKSNKYGKAKGGSVLAVRYQKDGKFFIGHPNRMFQYDADSSTQERRACLMFRIGDTELKKLIQTAKEKAGEFVFKTL